MSQMRKQLNKALIGNGNALRDITAEYNMIDDSFYYPT